MKPCQHPTCVASGALVDDASTVHWTGRGDERHRVDGSPLDGGTAPFRTFDVPAVLPDTRPEEEIRRGIREAFRAAGYYVWDTEQGYRHDGSSRVTPGLPDLLVMGMGRVLWVECKSARGRLSDAQALFRDVCAEVGIEHQVWRSETDAIQWLQEGQ
jgi:hypothetical protein